MYDKGHQCNWAVTVVEVICPLFYSVATLKYTIALKYRTIDFMLQAYNTLVDRAFMKASMALLTSLK